MDFGQSVGPPSEVETGDGVNPLKVIKGESQWEKGRER